jgi:hypothetical protein
MVAFTPKPTKKQIRPICQSDVTAERRLHDPDSSSSSSRWHGRRRPAPPHGEPARAVGHPRPQRRVPGARRGGVQMPRRARGGVRRRLRRRGGARVLPAPASAPRLLVVLVLLLPTKVKEIAR